MSQIIFLSIPNKLGNQYNYLKLLPKVFYSSEDKNRVKNELSSRSSRLRSGKQIGDVLFKMLSVNSERSNVEFLLSVTNDGEQSFAVVRSHRSPIKKVGKHWFSGHHAGRIRRKQSAEIIRICEVMATDSTISAQQKDNPKLIFRAEVLSRCTDYDFPLNMCQYPAKTS